MNRLPILLVLLSLVAVTGPAAAGPARDAAIVQRAVEDYIRPATARFADAAGRLADAVTAYCAAPGPATRPAVDTGFAATVEAWSGVQFLRFGPLVEGHRLERVAFWPDPKGIGQRQIRKALAGRDASVTDPGQLAGKSVALQGLPALEVLLYGDAEEAFACDYAAAAATSLAGLAAAVAADWADPAGFAGRLLRPDPADPLYRTPAEALGELHRALATGLQVTQDLKLKPVLGDAPDAARPFLAPFRRAGLGIAVLADDAAALRAFAEAAGFTRALPEEYSWLDGSMAFEFDNAVAAARAVSLPVDAAVYDEAARGRLQYLSVVLGNLRTMVQQDLAAALGLTVGFNALDGD